MNPLWLGSQCLGVVCSWPMLLLYHWEPFQWGAWKPTNFASAIPKVSRPIPLVTPEERSRAEGLFRDLQTLSIDEMRRRLESEEAVPARERHEVAKLVGIKAVAEWNETRSCTKS
jgi:hypothetical protein